MGLYLKYEYVSLLPQFQCLYYNYYTINDQRCYSLSNQKECATFISDSRMDVGMQSAVNMLSYEKAAVKRWAFADMVFT